MKPQRLSLFVVLLLATMAGAQDKKEPEVKVTKEEQQIFDLVNEARAKEKKPPLKWDAKLIEVARKHAANMAKQKKPDQHVLDGKDPSQRIDEGGYDWLSCGENLAWVDKPATIKPMFDGWMKSKDHRPHILGDYLDTGVGIIEDKAKGKGGYYITQVFGTLRKKPD